MTTEQLNYLLSYHPIYFPVDSIYGSTDPVILPDNFEVTKEEKKEEEKNE